MEPVAGVPQPSWDAGAPPDAPESSSNNGTPPAPSDSGPSQPCVDTVVNAAALDAGCLWAASSWAGFAAGGPIGVGIGVAVIGLTCGAAAYFDYRAVDECTKDPPPPPENPIDTVDTSEWLY